MRYILALAFTGCLLFATGCTSTQADYANPPLDRQIAGLERTQQQMRKQYDAMGETLIRLEQRISDLKAQQAVHASGKPAVAATAINKPTQLVASNTPPATNPTPAAATSSSTIGDLTDQDMEAQAVPAAAIKPAAAPVTMAVPQNGQSYLVHLASYLDTAPVKPGWRQLSRQNSEQLSNLKPYLTAYTDNQRRRWLRLSAGPFTTSAAAKQRCEELKAAGGWCDVLQVQTAAMRELR